MKRWSLSVRIQRTNPNHHLWNNNGTWWMHYTVHGADYTKYRIRRSLQTKRLEVARQRRDAILASLATQTDEAFRESPVISSLTVCEGTGMSALRLERCQSG